MSVSVLYVHWEGQAVLEVSYFGMLYLLSASCRVPMFRSPLQLYIHSVKQNNTQRLAAKKPTTHNSKPSFTHTG